MQDAGNQLRKSSLFKFVSLQVVVGQHLRGLLAGLGTLKGGVWS